MECKHCEYANLYDNNCLIDGRKLYDYGLQLTQDCKNYKDGDWTAEMNAEMNCDKGSDKN